MTQKPGQDFQDAAAKTPDDQDAAREALHTQMHESVWNGDYQRFMQALEQGADVNARSPSSSGLAALHEAAGSGEVAMLKVLIDRGAELNIQDRKGRTALHWAVGMSNARALELLVDSGASLTLRDGDGLTAIDYAHSEGKFEMALIMEMALSRLNARKVKNLFARSHTPRR